jgi:hypothetical protein
VFTGIDEGQFTRYGEADELTKLLDQMSSENRRNSGTQKRVPADRGWVLWLGAIWLSIAFLSVGRRDRRNALLDLFKCTRPCPFVPETAFSTPAYNIEEARQMIGCL